MGETTFSKKELERYSRHLIIPEFNIEGQRKLKESKVLVVGTGGLGSPLLLYLTAAGVGNIGLIDFDVVDDSNLQRQVLFGVLDVGKPKVEVAKRRLLELNPYINFTIYNEKLTSENALDIIANYDVVADGTDNFETRYLVNDACVILGKTNVYASIFRFEGQCSVFNYKPEGGDFGPNYRDLFPTPPPPGMVPSCAEGGVLGVLPGILGSLQANEVLKVVTGIGEPLSGRLFLFDALAFDTRVLKIRKNPDTPKIEKLIDYEYFCGLRENNKEEIMKELSVEELDELRKSGEEFQLIDVREAYEKDIADIGGDHIPLGTIEDDLDKIRKDVKVVVYCRSGARSASAVKTLEQYDMDNLYNLTGGILAWADEIDSNMSKY
jgi:sulfur-carrier protein adenylyltransferase/sulfurtransferase